MQEVIFWQGRTIQMMYHIIGQAMQRAGVQNQHPKDYLSFFCLGQFSSLPSPSVPSSSSLIHSIVYSFHSFTLSSYHITSSSTQLVCHSVIHSLSHSVSHSASQDQIPAVEKQVQHPLCCDPCDLPRPTPPWHRHTPGLVSTVAGLALCMGGSATWGCLGVDPESIMHQLKWSCSCF